MLVTLAIPDRLPSLIALVGVWIPPAVAGWVAADFLQRSPKRIRTSVIYVALTTFVMAYAWAWFAFNRAHMPPYIPGASIDPTFAPPKVVAALAVFTGALVLPASVLACVLAFRRRSRLTRG
jgi:hypothetical protein